LIRIEYAAARCVCGVNTGVQPGAAITLCIWLMRSLPLVLKTLPPRGPQNLEIAFEKAVPKESRSPWNI
jgi:hypothetical protein